LKERSSKTSTRSTTKRTPHQYDFGSSQPSGRPKLEDYEDEDDGKMLDDSDEISQSEASRSSSKRKSVLETAIPEPTVSEKLSDVVVSKPKAKAWKKQRKTDARSADADAVADTTSTDAQRRERPYLYGKPAPPRVVGKCAGCNGKRTDELISEPILLCDG